MPTVKLIADSGSTKTEWCLLKNNKPFIFFSQGMSPYFVDRQGMEKIIREEVLPSLKKSTIEEIYFYGTGCKNPLNLKMVKKAFQDIFPEAVFMLTTIFPALPKRFAEMKKGLRVSWAPAPIPVIIMGRKW